jgi:hypothetical protein
MRGTRKTAVVAVVAVVLALGFGSPAGAAGHAITVTPDSGLADGQTVHVTGTGFTETPAVNDWVATMCSGAILDQPPTLELAVQYCDATEGPYVFTHADSAGNIAFDFIVRKTFQPTGGEGTVDCASSGCAILVAQVTTAGFTGAAAPISFGHQCTDGARHGFGRRATMHCHTRAPHIHHLVSWLRRAFMAWIGMGRPR